MGKSSSSFSKRRRSKYSSQGRARKKSKTRRSKLKKLRRRYDSDSYSDDDSRSSLSISSSDSEDGYRSRRSRSRGRMDLRGSKKRARTRSSSSEESPHVRKRKGTKRYHERKKTHEKKTKKRMKKKVRRDTSINSGSGESLNCSTCQTSSSDSAVSEYETRKGRSERRKDEDRELKIHNWEAHEPDMMNRMVGENSSKRLRSVITFAREDNEGRELVKNKHKDEITYDYDDYPYSRSNDSNEGLNSRESAHQLRVASEKERPSDDKKEDDTASNIKATEPTETKRDGECQHARNKPGYDRVVTDDNKKENNEVSWVADDSVKGDDLETILRQKALENLRRFRRGPGGVQTNMKNAVQKDDVDVTAPSLARSELTQIKSTKDDGARVVKEDSPHSVLNEKFMDREKHGNEPRSAKNNVHMPDQVAIPVREKVSTIASSSKDKPRLITSALRQALPNVTTTLKETPASREANQAKSTSGTSLGKSATPKETPPLQKSNQAKLVSESSVGKSALIKTPGSQEANKPLLVTGSSVGMSGTQSVHTVTLPKGGDGDDKVNNASASAPSEPSSCIASVAGDISLNKSQGEGKEGSQFEQKTMSVLRGGETVQVSYKVYIPKKAPALARRQLKR